MVRGVADSVKIFKCMSGWLVALVLLSGCGGCGRAEPAGNMDSDGSTTSRLIIHSPATGATGKSDRAVVFWDGKQIWSGKLPTRSSGPDAMPYQLIELPAKGGHHTLELHYDDTKTRVDVVLKDGEKRHFMLFGSKDGQPVLIEDLGNNPIFL